MATLLVSSSLVSTRLNLANNNCLSFRHSDTLLPSSSSPLSTAAIRFDALSCRWNGYTSSSSTRKKSLLVAGAGAPSTTSLIFAFVFPLSLLIGTILVSIRIADKLDKDFLEELAINEEIMQEEDQDGDMSIPVIEEPIIPRSRNRPKREVQVD